MKEKTKWILVLVVNRRHRLNYRLERTLSEKISSKRHIFRVTSRVEYSVYSVLFTPGRRKRVYMSFKRVLVWTRHNDCALLLPSFRSGVRKLSWIRSNNSARDISCQRKFCGNLGNRRNKHPYHWPLADFLTHLVDVTRLCVGCANKGAHAGATNHVNRDTWQKMVME